ncbi:hypothetical protein O9Z17_003863, partial [Salmonella enterica]|nr:hypothetical protein [Salmonella enterica]
AAVRPAITTAATSCAGRERSRASASPAVTICTLPERWRGAPAVPDTRGICAAVRPVITTVMALRIAIRI